MRALHQMTLRPMGRVLRVYDAETGDEIVRPSPGGFRTGRFVIDGLPGVYEGFTRGESWNGFSVPFFSLAEARRIAADYAEQPASPDGQTRADYDADRDVIRLYDPTSGEWDEIVPIEADGLSLYPVGARFWTWEEMSGHDS